MGILDLPAPLFGAVDGLLEGFLPPLIRLVLWGILAGWLTMIVYRRLSRQDRIGELKSEQKAQQKLIAEFEGEFNELMPLIRKALLTGLNQLGLALGPALLATIPVLFLIVWVAGEFGYQAPQPGTEIALSAEPGFGGVRWEPDSAVRRTGEELKLAWPSPGEVTTLSGDEQVLLNFPLVRNVPVIHKKQWWNVFMANPIGYLPDELDIEVIEIDLPEQVMLSFGPTWIRGWMFSFFLTFLLSSVAFKFVLKIE